MTSTTMSREKISLQLLSLIVLLSGCGAGFQTSGDIDQGRQALFAQNYQGALGSFQTAAQTDPSYVYTNALQEGVFSYLGRAQYLTGQYAQARQSLEKDLAQRSGDNLARLYLGLTLARLGDRPSGLRDIEAALKGIQSFLTNITTNEPNDIALYWDPGRVLRNSVASNLTMIAGGNFDWPTLIKNCEFLGINFEEEPDRALQQSERERENDMGR